LLSSASRRKNRRKARFVFEAAEIELIGKDFQNKYLLLISFMPLHELRMPTYRLAIV